VSKPGSEKNPFLAGTPGEFGLLLFCGMATRPIRNVVYKKSVLSPLGVSEKSNNCQKWLNLIDGGRELYILRTIVGHSHLGSFTDQVLYCVVLLRRFWPFPVTANVGTEGAVKKFLFSDVSEEFLITQSVLNGLT
jgi:hypothetical protein